MTSVIGRHRRRRRPRRRHPWPESAPRRATTAPRRRRDRRAGSTVRRRCDRMRRRSRRRRRRARGERGYGRAASGPHIASAAPAGGRARSAVCAAGSAIGRGQVQPGGVSRRRSASPDRRCAACCPCTCRDQFRRMQADCYRAALESTARGRPCKSHLRGISEVVRQLRDDGPIDFSPSQPAAAAATSSTAPSKCTLPAAAEQAEQVRKRFTKSR